jgi:hypothetical protein
MTTRWIYIGLSVLISIVIGYCFGGALRASLTALSGIISVFSILAGVLVAVISIIGDPSMLLTGNWRLGYVHAQEIQTRIARYAILILLYVIILIGVLLAIIVQENKIVGHQWIFSLVGVLTALGLLLSLPLPFDLMSIQKERMKEEIRRRQNSPNSSQKSCE